MDKYETLKKKLNNILEYMDNIKMDNNGIRECLLEYRESVLERIKSINNKTIRDSNGALFGLVREISDFDEICKDIQFLKMLADADRYYRDECYKF